MQHLPGHIPAAQLTDPLSGLGADFRRLSRPGGRTRIPLYASPRTDRNTGCISKYHDSHWCRWQRYSAVLLFATITRARGNRSLMTERQELYEGACKAFREGMGKHPLRDLRKLKYSNEALVER